MWCASIWNKSPSRSDRPPSLVFGPALSGRVLIPDRRWPRRKERQTHRTNTAMLPKIITQVQKLHNKEKATMLRVDLADPSTAETDDVTCEGFHKIWLRMSCEATATKAPVTKLRTLIRLKGTVQDPCLLAGLASSPVVALPREPERGRRGSVSV